jgi:hypothetical protein
MHDAGKPAYPIPPGRLNGALHAFPWQRKDAQELLWSDGLTKREAIAALALQGLLANPHSDGVISEAMAMRAIRHADALLEGFEK